MKKEGARSDIVDSGWADYCAYRDRQTTASRQRFTEMSAGEWPGTERPRPELAFRLQPAIDSEKGRWFVTEDRG